MNWNRGRSCSRRSRTRSGEMLRPQPTTWNRGRSCNGRNRQIGERADYVLVFSGSPAAAAAGPPGQALGYAAPFCRLNALWLGILRVIRTSSRSSTSSSNRASHSTATQ